MVTVLRQGPVADGVDYREGYPVATVELDEQPGLRVVGTVVGVPAAAVRIGQRVEIAWIERHGVPWLAFDLVDAGGRG